MSIIQQRASPSLIGRAAGRLRRELRARRVAAALADPSRSPTIVCASIGRVGSTMLHRCIVESRAQSILGSFEQSDFALISSVDWHLDRGPIRPGRVSKTHDFPHALDRSAPLKVVYSFGRPSDIVLSVLRKAATGGAGWRDRHLCNMHASGAFDELPDRDILRLEEQLDAWRAVTDLPLLAIHYDALWDVRPILDAFLGFTVALPERRPRRFDDLDPAIVTRVRHTYARLDDKVASLPSYWRIDG